MTAAVVPAAREVAPVAVALGSKPAARRGALTLADQAIVSGTNFLTVLLIGRACAPAELGLYVLGFTILILVTQVQQSLVAVPLTIFSAGASDARRRDLWGAGLVLWLAISFVTSVSLAASALVASSYSFESSIAHVLGVLAITTPLILLREFARRVELARLQPVRALILDTLSSCLQLGTLGAAFWTGELSSMTAHVILGVACAVVALGWLWSVRRDFGIHSEQLRADMGRYLRLGRWLVGANLVFVANVYMMQWMLWFSRGATATGLWAAAATLVDLSNPFILGMGNLFGPQAAHTYAAQGVGALRSVVIRFVFFVGATMASYAVLLSLLADHLLTWLFRPEFAQQGALVALLSLAAFIQSLGMPLGDALSTIRRPQLNLLAGLLALVVTIICTVALLPSYGLMGSAAALLAGNVTNVTCRHAFFWLAARSAVEVVP